MNQGHLCDDMTCLLLGLSLLNEPVFRRKGLEAKLWAKDIIVKHYTSLEVCLVPQRFLELHLAILSLILSNNVDNGKICAGCFSAYFDLFVACLCVHSILQSVII